MNRFVKLFGMIALLVYAFEKGYKEGYRQRNDKFPEWGNYR